MTLGLGGIAIGVLFQVCSGDSDLSIIVTGLSFRCLSCLNIVAVLVIQVGNGSLRLVSQTSGVDRPGLSGRDGEGAVFFGGRQAGLQILRAGILGEGTAGDHASAVLPLGLNDQARCHILIFCKGSASHRDRSRIRAHVKVGICKGAARNRNIGVIKCLDAAGQLRIPRDGQLAILIGVLTGLTIALGSNGTVDRTARNCGVVPVKHREKALASLCQRATLDI